MERTLHGLTKHRFYMRWVAMMNRCHNENDKAYKDYGARGISVSDEFKNTATFLKYLDELDGYGVDGRTSLDRIENDGNYERGNLKWSNRTEQQNNKTLYKNNTSGFPGIFYRKRYKKWWATVYIKSKQIYIGCADSPEEAFELRKEFVQTKNQNKQ